MIERGELFLRRISLSRNKIANLCHTFIKDGAVSSCLFCAARIKSFGVTLLGLECWLRHLLKPWTDTSLSLNFSCMLIRAATPRLGEG